MRSWEDEHGFQEEQLGSGTYGKVFLTSKSLAVKEFDIENDGIFDSFCREILAVHRINSPWVCPILDFGQNLQRVWTIMPLGQPLGEFSWQKLADLVQGLRDSHAVNVYHQDLTIRNALLLPDRAVWTDFGSASFTERGRSGSYTTIISRSPESLLGSEYNLPSEIWALGCIVWEWVVGEWPFNADSEVGCLFSQFRFFGTPSEETWPGVSKLRNWKSYVPKFKGSPQWEKIADPDVRTLLQKLLVMNPVERWKLADVLAYPPIQAELRTLSKLWSPRSPRSPVVLSCSEIQPPSKKPIRRQCFTMSAEMWVRVETFLQLQREFDTPKVGSAPDDFDNAFTEKAAILLAFVEDGWEIDFYDFRAIRGKIVPKSDLVDRCLQLLTLAGSNN